MRSQFTEKLRDAAAGSMHPPHSLSRQRPSDNSLDGHHSAVPGQLKDEGDGDSLSLLGLDEYRGVPRFPVLPHADGPSEDALDDLGLSLNDQQLRVADEPSSVFADNPDQRLLLQHRGSDVAANTSLQ
jgi:hypothetical protein